MSAHDGCICSYGVGLFFPDGNEYAVGGAKESKHDNGNDECGGVDPGNRCISIRCDGATECEEHAAHHFTGDEGDDFFEVGESD